MNRVALASMMVVLTRVPRPDPRALGNWQSLPLVCSA